MGERRGRVGSVSAVEVLGKDVSISVGGNGSTKGKKQERGASRGKRC